MTAREIRILELERGREIGYAEYGAPDGTVVFGFHGTPGSHRQLAAMDDAARAVGVRLIAPDRPGYGHSTFLSDRRLIDWPRDVMALADHLSIERFGVIGISGGGPHAVVTAHQLRDRVIAAVSVAGVGPMTEQSDAEGMMAINRGIVWLARRSPVAVRVPFNLFRLGARYMPRDRTIEQMKAQLPPADAAIMGRPGVADDLIDEQAQPHATAASAAAQDFTLFSRPWGFELSEIAVPFHIFHGDADRNVPLHHSERFAEVIPDAQLNVMPGLGHLLEHDLGREILTAAAGLDT